MIDPERAVDWAFANDPAAARAVLEDVFAGVDVVVQPADGRAKRLLVADMDSTMIQCECIDELADFAGIKPQIAANSTSKRRWMRGSRCSGDWTRRRSTAAWKSACG